MPPVIKRVYDDKKRVSYKTAEGNLEYNDDIDMPKLTGKNDRTGVSMPDNRFQLSQRRMEAEAKDMETDNDLDRKQGVVKDTSRQYNQQYHKANKAQREVDDLEDEENNARIIDDPKLAGKAGPENRNINTNMVQAVMDRREAKHREEKALNKAEMDRVNNKERKSIADRARNDNNMARGKGGM